MLLRVDDSGPGIAPAARARAFERFWRRDDGDDGGVMSRDHVIGGDDGERGDHGRDHERVHDRDHGSAGGSGSGSGSGLGLAIVRSVAERHGASVRLGDSALGGLRVDVVFTPAA